MPAIFAMPNRRIRFFILDNLYLQSMRLLCLVFFFFSVTPVVGQPVTDSLLKQILERNKDSVFVRVLNNPEMYRLQVIYTEINRDKHNKPSFKNFYYNYDPDLYFNPASTVKLPLALLALEKLNKMHIKGVNKFTPVQFDSTHEKQVMLYKDSSAKDQLPSIAQFIRKAFLVSDNDAYNRLYQFVGQQDINKALHAKGYHDIRITRQFMGFTSEENRHTNQVRFIHKDGRLLYLQPATYNTDSFSLPPPVKIGKAHYDRNDSLINEPIDFTYANNLSLYDLQQILQSVLFSSSLPGARRFKLTKKDYQFLYRYLSQYPSETNYPKYDPGKFYNSYVKFYFKHGSREMPERIRVFNKVGWAYGFLTDVSYVADFKNKVEFMLTTTVYVNSDGILNDDQYDYDSIGYPFLYQLGQVVYAYELKRKRPHEPDLSKFKMQYEQRDLNDHRPAIKEVDN